MSRRVSETYRSAFNEEFRVEAQESGSAFVPLMGVALDEVLCEQFERTVGADNCVAFESRKLQIPASGHRMHYVKVKVRVHRYGDGSLAVFHGPRKLAEYEAEPGRDQPKIQAAA
ncbi:hypothetical protein [Nitrococcus mobilis]|uniref:Uncharacterized protein n=1 Tax=Nitrococcus mobilis Nb-231 TaxID=314278 RepID=A4BM85_9GAMM|nr:hypothetical protein [Nitrococcus mobilis]EAR23423.1 hypothetical protein NB231_16423 [Nitrococcus mobilis Nb-231]